MQQRCQQHCGGPGGLADRVDQAAGDSPASGGASSSGGTVITTAKSSAGTVLTSGSGKAVYVWTKDTGDMSNCNGACASAWPPVTTTRPRPR